MNGSASSKSAQSVPRADSPMQEDVGLVHAASARDTRPTNFSASRPDAPPSGFTAVNGDRRIALFRPDNSASSSSRPQKGEHAKSSTSDAPRPSPLNHPSTWPRAEHADADRGAHVNKRKRADSAGHQAGEDGPSLAAAVDAAAAAPSSSKKRPSNPINNSRTSARSPETNVVTADRRAPESAVTITYARERSPDSTRWNNGEPPPPPRPEIAAGLAESIQRSLSSLKQQQGRKPSTASEHEHCNPPADLHAPEPDSASPSGEAPESPSGENKPRKRNFSNRTKTGCHTCRFRKKKCDEGKPVCGNCLRGQFVCKGYGPRPPGSSSKAVRQVQHAGPGQQAYEHASNQAPPPSQSQPPPPPRRETTPSRYYPPVEPVHPPQPYAPWERMIPPTTSNDKFRHPPRYSEPAPADHRPSSSRDAWPPHDAPPAFAQDHRPPPDYHQVPPLASYGPHRPPLPDPWGAPTPVPTYRPPTAAGTVISGRDSVTTSSSNVSQLPLSYGPTGQLSERSKMITGKPYRHFLDDELIRDRQSCKRAVESYNDAARASSTLSPAEKERLFKAVIDPSSRAYDGDAAMHWRGPKGTCGARTIVECPFTCDYGYNIHFGDDAVISPNCQMQDACDIYIGNRTVVGPNVMFYCMTTSIDPSIRKGSQGNFTAGAIKVEDDVYIGAGVIIMPFRTIGKGAVIGAGSVVTKDVKPYTVVAGNPAKFIRRINRGQRDESHQNPDIQEQNERMLERMQSGLSYGYRDRFL